MELTIKIDKKIWFKAGYEKDIQDKIYNIIEKEIEKCRQSFSDLQNIKEIIIEVKPSQANSFLGQMMAKKIQEQNILSGIMKLGIGVLQKNDTNELSDVIMHEILHLLPGGKGHRSTWRERADFINEKYGYNLKRYGKAHEWIGKREQNKYLLKCGNCGQKYYYKRKTKYVRYYKRVRCGRCGGKLGLTVLI